MLTSFTNLICRFFLALLKNAALLMKPYLQVDQNEEKIRSQRKDHDNKINLPIHTCKHELLS